MQQASQVSARRHVDTGEGLLDGTSASYTGAAFEHQHALTGTRQVRRASKAVVAGAHDDGIPGTGGKLSKGLREADLAQDRGCG
jgi:hypothetical protein